MVPIGVYIVKLLFLIKKKRKNAFKVLIELATKKPSKIT